MSEPLVTVLMPVYNAGPYLKDSIHSILHQSYKNIEFLIVNDGSTDKSAQVISSFTDKRIRVISNYGNKGLVFSLNQGLKEAKGEYIARMDADDIALRERLRKQINFLIAHPEISICGASIEAFDEEEENEVYFYPQTHEECVVHLLFNTCFAHPTVIFRKSEIEKYNIQYKAEFFPAEDFELWSANGDKLKYANLPEVLYKYRVHDVQTSLARLESQNKIKLGIQLNSIRKLIPGLTESEAYLFGKITGNYFEYNEQFLKDSEALFARMLQSNQATKTFGQAALEKELQREWFALCTEFASNSVYSRKIFSSSLVAKDTPFNWTFFRFLVKNFMVRVKLM
jgi:glycosyltransferase involved in cell wall biosynthesis